jgi:ParB-like chromosome segregation protein Spo0J
MNLLQAEIEMNAMIAENKQREALGESMAYTEKDFLALVDKHGIHHNKFPYYCG